MPAGEMTCCSSLCAVPALCSISVGSPGSRGCEPWAQGGGRGAAPWPRARGGSCLPRPGCCCSLRVLCSSSQPVSSSHSTCVHPFTSVLLFSLTLLPRHVSPARSFGCPKLARSVSSSHSCHCTMGDVTFPPRIHCPHCPTGPPMPSRGGFGDLPTPCSPHQGPRLPRLLCPCSVYLKSQAWGCERQPGSLFRCSTSRERLSGLVSEHVLYHLS